jgi:drug/metabolite transporter (DMT)-like permease
MGRIPSGTTVALALGAVYFIWGSTYLAIRFGLESFPPLILNGLRFLLPGIAMYVALRSFGTPAPCRRQWWNLARVAGLMLVGGAGLATIAQDVGVGSGLVATAVAMIPVWAAVVSSVLGARPRRLEWIGLVVGLLGVAVLAQEGDFQASILGMLLVIVAPVSWAVGSVWQTRLDMPQPAMTTAAALLSGGALLLILGLLGGERIAAAPTVASLYALLYLIIFGSIVGYTAYIYLLRHTRPVLATSYAYVNPAFAVLLGMTLGAETVTGPIMLALPLILSGVAIVGLGQRQQRMTTPDVLLGSAVDLSGTESNPRGER